jgi:hypothetical protein
MGINCLINDTGDLIRHVFRPWQYLKAYAKHSENTADFVQVKHV